MLYQNKNNEVREYTEIDKINGFIPKDFKQLTEAQIIAYENKPYFGTWNGNEWIKDDEKCEQERVNLINQKANEIIEAKYPLYKQLNIRGKLLKDETTGTYYNDTDIEIMDMFIDTARGIAKTAKANETHPEDIDWAEIDKRMSIFLTSLEK